MQTNEQPRIRASLASVPGREESLEQAVGSLLDQVDVLCVYLNGHDAVPDFLSDERIAVAGTADGGPDLGAAGKFHWNTTVPLDYQLCCDDDLCYPAGYATSMVAAIDRYGRRAVVGVHGALLREGLGPTYEACRARVFAFSEALRPDRAVHVLGTGTLAYHCSTVAFRPSPGADPNADDVDFAVACQLAQIPRVAISRPSDWIRQLPVEHTLWERNRRSTGLVETLRRATDWRLIEP